MPLEFSRTDPAYARQVIEQLAPDAEQRRQVLHIIADLIEEANEKPQNWGITLHHVHEVALNIGGGYYCLWLRKNNLKFMWKGIADPEPEGSTTQFASIPDSRSARGPIGKALIWLPAIRLHISELIQFTNSKSKVLQGGSRRAHSPGVLRYIEEELGITLADPVYPGNTEAFGEDETSSEVIPMPIFPLNTILYGPPGTGKTFETANRAVQIIDGDTYDDRAELMDRYKQLERDGSIAFVTFHQSYSYEDFIEGIRPVMGEDEDADGESVPGEEIPRYECVRGLLRRIATRALFALLEPVPNKPITPVRTSFDILWRKLIRQIQEYPEQEYPVAGNTGIARFRIQPTRWQNLEGQNVTTQQTHWPYQCGRERVRLVFEALRDQNAVSPQQVKEAFQTGAHYPFVATVINLLKKIESNLPTNESTDAISFPSLTANEQASIVRRFLKSGEASGYRIQPDPNNWPRFVLIVDEINRGNISKILGELITLLEDDKRVGKTNELIVILPYSRERFALPPNLYILGTMNTADKSIALVDVALRRRFEFEELRPKFSVCQGLTAEMRTLLETLNQRIALRKDRDHRIGHAFFVSVVDEAGFNRVFERQIIPLLAEYFYGDWEGLRWVLQETTTTTGFIRKIPESNNDRMARNHWQWYLDSEDTEPFKPLDILKTNYKVSA